MLDAERFSPFLEGYLIGGTMSDHDGVRCYPAMKEDSKSKYIVKTLSIPASQSQLDALLLTGAYHSPADAKEYFETLADGVIKEAEILHRLSKLEGFAPYEKWQTFAMGEDRMGYEVCLVSPYRRSLEKYMRRHLMTHLEAVNLGLDLCAALAICRRSGYLYIDLKPGNIFITKTKEYQIGDLGFAELDSLQYTSLPGKYRSPYTPPEIQDALNPLNITADTYSVGMILYQIYNDGQLPQFPGNPEDTAVPPVNADYEIAEIIMKAIAADPKDRWQDPMLMGQALVAYMQRNSINDVPITPPPAVIENTAPSLEETQQFPVITDTVQDETIPSEEDIDSSAVTEEVSSIVAEAEEILEQSSPDVDADSEQIPLPETETAPEESETEEAASEAPESAEAELEETVPDESEAVEEEMSAETEGLDSNMPEDVSITPAIPEFIMPVSIEEDDDEDFSIAFVTHDEPAPEPTAVPEEPAQPIRKRKPRKSLLKTLVGPICSLLVTVAIAACGYWYYHNMYLQTIRSITVDGTQSYLTVHVDTDVAYDKLTVLCTDTYGNTKQQTLTDGRTVFSDLLPNSQYKIQLQISGFHKLVGQTSDVFNTKSRTTITSFSAVTGSEDGTALLTFTVDGAEPEKWTVICSAPNQPTITETFTGHNVTLKGLVIGQSYTMQLRDGTNQVLLGQSSIEFTASHLVVAENLDISKGSDSEIKVRWDAPEGITVESWYVRCYDNNGYDESQEVVENEAVFSGLDHTNGYTVEVTAAEMTQPARATITANPVIITNLNVDANDPAQLTLSWEYEGKAPEGGWHILYSMDGGNGLSIVKSDEATAVITPRIPSATYEFIIQAADSTSVLNSIHSYKCPGAEILDYQALSAEKITSYLLKTPEGNWTYEGVGNKAFTDQFASGDPISMVLHANTNYYINSADVPLLYVIRDGNGNVITDLISQEVRDWRNLWYGGDYHYAELDIPQVPTEPGSYSLSLYINHQAVTIIQFTIV